MKGEVRDERLKEARYVSRPGCNAFSTAATAMYGAMQMVEKASIACRTAVSEPGARFHTHPGSLSLCTQAQVSSQKELIEKPWLVLELFEQKLEEGSAKASHCCLGMSFIPPPWATPQWCCCCACAWPWPVDWFLDLMLETLLRTCLVVWTLTSHSMVGLASC